MNHKKHDARQNAAKRIVNRDHLSEQPKIVGSDQDISQGRFTGETALTGEDRPADEAGGKRHKYSPTAAADHAAAGHPTARKSANAVGAGDANELSRAEGADYKR